MLFSADTIVTVVGLAIAISGLMCLGSSAEDARRIEALPILPAQAHKNQQRGSASPGVMAATAVWTLFGFVIFMVGAL